MEVTGDVGRAKEVMVGSEAQAGLSETVLMTAVARRYYLEGRSKIEIADQLGVSRFKVARLLEKALATGLVRIEIVPQGGIDGELSSRLQEAFGLRHCLVAAAPEEPLTALRSRLGRVGAGLLTEILTAKDVLGLAWARSLSAMADSIEHLPAVEVVQLTGALQRPDVSDSSIDLVREVARIGGGAAFYYYAPMIVANPVTAEALRHQPEVARALARVPDVTIAFVGIGSLEPQSSTVLDALDPAARQQLRRDGVFAEISGVPIDRDGRPVASAVSQRVIGLDAEQLAAIPVVVAIAYGVEKVEAVRAALTGGLVSGLVTHAEMARALLGSPALRSGRLAAGGGAVDG